MTTSAFEELAVGLAGLGAVLFGLGAVRQQHAVRRATAPASTWREKVASGWLLVRQRSWIAGAVQAALGGSLHVVALALAPITLVQPVGVLAVPVTVVATSLRRRRRPSRSDLLGTVCAVTGVAGLTWTLLPLTGTVSAFPTWSAVAAGGGATLAAVVALALLVSRAPLLLRCVVRAAGAAVCFGTVSVSVRLLGEVVGGTVPAAAGPGLVATTVLVLLAALPLGIGLVQAAYADGSSQIVLCCLTVVDPLTAVVVGRVLLHDGSALTGLAAAAAAGLALTASFGVVLLARGYPVEDPRLSRRSHPVAP